MSSRVVIAADDYALAPGVSRAILELIRRGRISATGCMTVSPFWKEHAGWLRPWRYTIDVGLHLTLTDHAPLGPMPLLAPGGRLPSLGALLRASALGQIAMPEIAVEVQRQINAFVRHFRHPPAYIDGHQHVHLLPGVRQAVMLALGGLPAHVWLRDCREPPTAILRRGIAPAKALFIGWLGAGLGQAIDFGRLPANRGFRGVYDFSGRVPFSELMARFLAPAGRNPARPPLVMVHPGFPDDDLRRLDPITDQRQVEYDYLSGDGFVRLLAERALTISPLTAPPAPA
ncbi:MAG: ChbG/HpnK family deacetylase [Rhodospirillaceae bacterium]